LTDEERLDWLRLIRSENVGPITFRQLLARLGEAAAALEALPDLARRGGRMAPISIFPKNAAEREIEQLGRLGARLVAFCEPDYPAALAAVEDAPPLIAIQGNAHLLQRVSVAMVGARNASANGRRLAEDFARHFAEEGFLVVSGLARGIDAAAHRGALQGGTAPVAWTSSTRAKTKPCRAPSAIRASSWPSYRPGHNPWPGTFRAATGSSRAWPWASWWSRRRPGRAR
jgi:DNA processing protein